MKIRKGNDITVDLQLPIGYNENEQLSQPIRGFMRVFFVNKTLEQKIKDEYINKNRFIGRFPIEPFVKEFTPTPHNINNSGFPQYRAYLHNEYRGFGVKPNWDKCFPIVEENVTRYEALVTHVNSSTIRVTFPAEAQLFEGDYYIVATGKIYDGEYSTGARTVTVNTSTIFTIVGDTADQEGVDNAVRIEWENINSDLIPVDVYAVSGEYHYDTNPANVIINRNDDARFNININPISGWYEGD